MISPSQLILFLFSLRSWLLCLLPIKNYHYSDPFNMFYFWLIILTIGQKHGKKHPQFSLPTSLIFSCYFWCICRCVLYFKLLSFVSLGYNECRVLLVYTMCRLDGALFMSRDESTFSNHTIFCVGLCLTLVIYEKNSIQWDILFAKICRRCILVRSDMCSLYIN